MRNLEIVPKAKEMVESFSIQLSPPVKAALSRIPREIFIPKEFQTVAYADQALGIGEGQTISQPSLVAKMTNLLDLKGFEKVLEIGTGSGYQTAILAQLAKKVITVEYNRKLAAKAELTIMKLGIDNVEVAVGDGSAGYPAETPYDAVIVTAAAPDVPQPLLDQMRVGAKMVIPVGGRHSQELLRIFKRKDGEKVEQWGSVQFVPLLGKYGWKD